MVNYNDSLLPYTEVISIFYGYPILINGIQNFNESDLGNLSHCWIKGKSYRIKYVKLQRVDTVNTIRWFDGKLPFTRIDSSILKKKIGYSLMLFIFNEKRLNENNVKKIRLLFPEDNISAQGKWRMIKVLLYNDSIVINKKVSDVFDTVGYRIIANYSNRIRETKRKSLLKELSSLEEFEGCECFQDNYYPMLLEYFDGCKERTYIISNRCKNNDNLERKYAKVINKVCNLR